MGCRARRAGRYLTSPAVIFCDNFDQRALGSGDLGRGTYKAPSGRQLANFPPGGSIEVVNSPGTFFSAPNAAEITYPAGENGGGPFMSAYFTQFFQEVYYRWYVKWSANYVWSDQGTKGWGAGYASTGKGVNLLGRDGRAGPLTIYATQGVVPTDTCFTALGYIGQVAAYELCPNLLDDSFVTTNTWYCFEVHIKMNSNQTTNQVDDGLAGAWIDGVKVLAHYNLNLDAVIPPGSERTIRLIYNAGGWNCSGGSVAAQDGSNQCLPPNPINYHPLMYRWTDNYVVSTQRVGCLGSAPPPGDTMPPANPTGLRVQ